MEIPAAFGRSDLAYCLTNHKAQGRTFDSAFVLANPAMCDRERTYVAASRSRFATTIFVNAAGLGLADPESHRRSPRANREQAIDALAKRMSRSRAKGTSLDYEQPPEPAKATDLRALAKLPEGRAKARLQRHEHGKASIRAKVEHPFRVIKRQFGLVKVRFRGLQKNTAQLLTLFALSNLWMARRQLMGVVRPKAA